METCAVARGLRVARVADGATRCCRCPCPCSVVVVTIRRVPGVRQGEHREASARTLEPRESGRSRARHVAEVNWLSSTKKVKVGLKWTCEWQQEPTTPAVEYLSSRWRERHSPTKRSYGPPSPSPRTANHVSISLGGIASSSQDIAYAQVCERIDTLVECEAFCGTFLKYWTCYQGFTNGQRAEHFGRLQDIHAAWSSLTTEDDATRQLGSWLNDVAAHRIGSPQQPTREPGQAGGTSAPLSGSGQDRECSRAGVSRQLPEPWCGCVAG